MGSMISNRKYFLLSVSTCLLLIGLYCNKYLTHQRHGRRKVFREDLPVLHQLLPDDLPHDLLVDAEQLVDGGVGVVEAVQQNLGHMSLLIPYQPERIRKSTIESMLQRSV